MENTEEKWKDIEEYEGLYQVSNLGRVKSLGNGVTHKEERILKQRKDNGGYLKVHLCCEGKHKHHSVHRLVAQAFIPNPDNLPQVNHKDENKQNNCVDNLEWCTSEYNNNYGARTLKCSRQIVQMDLENNIVGIYISIMEVKRQLGFDNSCISKCCRGKTQTAYGYKWQYLN